MFSQLKYFVRLEELLGSYWFLEFCRSILAEWLGRSSSSPIYFLWTAKASLAKLQKNKSRAGLLTSTRVCTKQQCVATSEKEQSSFQSDLLPVIPLFCQLWNKLILTLLRLIPCDLWKKLILTLLRLIPFIRSISTQSVHKLCLELRPYNEAYSNSLSIRLAIQMIIYSCEAHRENESGLPFQS